MAELIKMNVCHGCLSTDRKILPLGPYFDMFLSLVGDNKQYLIYTNEELVLCWECLALIKRLKLFQDQLQNAQSILMQILYGLDFKYLPLSKLSVLKKDYYDHEMEYIEDIEPLKSTDLDIKYIKVEINSEDNIDTKFYTDMNDTTVHDISNDSIKVEKEINKSKTRKGRLNNLTNYMEHVLVERKKLNVLGDIPKLVSVYHFSEQEMEEHILCKERIKFRRKLIHTCKHCKLRYLKQIDLKRHNDLNHHEPETPYTCSICKKSKNSLQSLEEHWREHSIVNKCMLCLKMFRDKELVQHLSRSHHKTYVCRYCDEIFGKLKIFMDHYREVHEQYVCDYCKECFKRRKSLEIHICNKHMKYTCVKCKKTHKSRLKHRRHWIKFHAPADPELRFCVECDRLFRTVQLYKQHLHSSTTHRRMKTGRERMISCPDCGKITQQKNLTYHFNKYHAKTKLKKNCCKICDKHFARPSGLRTHHAAVHLKVPKERNIICDICGKGFTSTRIMRNHRATHTGERPYKCDVCSATFIQKYAMKMHMNKKHGDKDTK